MPRPSFLAALALALAMGLPAAEAGPTAGYLLAESLQASGANAVNGQVVAFLREPLPLPDQPLPPADFELQARQLRVEVDTADPVIHAQATKVLVPGTFSTASTEHTDAVVQGMGNARAAYRWALFGLTGSPLPHVHIANACTTLQAPDSDQISRIPRAQDQTQRPARTASTVETLLWTGCSDGRLTIRGDFGLSLWEWDARLEAAGETRDLISGSTQSQHAPADARAAASRDQEVYLFARDATLTVPLVGPAKLYLESGATLESGAGFTFSEVRGQFDAGEGTQTVDSRRLDLLGQLTIVARGYGPGEPFLAGVMGQLSSAEADGRPLAVASATAPVPTWLWLAPTLALAVLLIAFAKPANAYAHYGLAYWRTRHGQLDKAIQDHERVERALHGRRRAALLSRNASEAARSCMELGRHVEALAWFKVALAHDQARAQKKL